MTTALALSLIATLFFLVSLGGSITNLVRREETIPLGLIWAVWGVGLVFLILSWLL